MKILSALTTAMSGSLGGIVGSHNRGGAYLRGKVMPVQPRTASQTANRNRLAAFSAAYRALTQSQIAGWNALASTVTISDALGQSINPSGQNLYVACNMRLASIGISTALSNAPSQPSIPGFTSFSVTPHYTTGLLDYFALACEPPIPSTVGLIVRGAASQSTGRTFISKSAFRTLSGTNPAPSAPANVSTTYTNVFGPFPGTGVVAFELILVDPASGFAGPPIRQTAAFASSAVTDLFSLAVGSQGGTTSSGSGTVTFVVTPTAIGGFSGAVSYETLGLPADCTYTVSHNPYTVASTVTVSVVAASATPGTYSFTIKGTYGSFSTSQTATLTIA